MSLHGLHPFCLTQVACSPCLQLPRSLTHVYFCHEGLAKYQYCSEFRQHGRTSCEAFQGCTARCLRLVVQGTHTGRGSCRLLTTNTMRHFSDRTANRLSEQTTIQLCLCCLYSDMKNVSASLKGTGDGGVVYHRPQSHIQLMSLVYPTS